MPDTGEQFPALASAADWTNPNACKALDSSYTYVQGGLPGLLRAYLFDVGVPNGATITGLRVIVYQAKFGKLDGPPVTENPEADYSIDVALLQRGLVATEYRHTRLSQTHTNYTYGGSSDLWGLTWTPADVSNGATSVIVRSGVGIDEDRTEGVLRILDAISLTVYYEGGSGDRQPVSLPIGYEVHQPDHGNPYLHDAGRFRHDRPASPDDCPMELCQYSYTWFNRGRTILIDGKRYGLPYAPWRRW